MTDTERTDQQIVKLFNQEGLTNKNNPYTLGSIKWIRCKHSIPSVILLRKPDEFTIEEVAKKFNVSHYVVRYWIECNIVNTRRLGFKFWVLIDVTCRIVPTFPQRSQSLLLMTAA